MAYMYVCVYIISKDKDIDVTLDPGYSISIMIAAVDLYPVTNYNIKKFFPLISSYNASKREAKYQFESSQLLLHICICIYKCMNTCINKIYVI